MGKQWAVLQSRPVTLDQKEERLQSLIKSYGRAVIAFSGGVDSSYLAYMAARVLGPEALCVTAVSPAVSQLQRGLARDFARAHQLNHVEKSTDELEDPNYSSNPDNRCYFCKSELYGLLDRVRREWNADVIFDGSNRDDLGDYRPGRLAAGEKGVVSPLVEAGLSKDEIRQLSRRLGLSSWNLPAMPCLSSRFPYGTEITAEKLAQVERSEAYLWELGLRNFRVRHHGQLARLEVSREELPIILEASMMSRIEQKLKDFGYRWVTLDLSELRSGSLNDLVVLDSSRQPDDRGAQA